MTRVTALQLTSTGVRVSRRTLRNAGLRGCDAELSALVKAVTTELDSAEISGGSPFGADRLSRCARVVATGRTGTTSPDRIIACCR